VLQKVPSMNEAALLLSGAGPSSENGRIARLLAFFGVPSGNLPLRSWLARDTGHGGSGKVRLFCSSDVFGELLEACQRDARAMDRWRSHVHSAFVYAGQDSRALQDLVRRLTGDRAATVSSDARLGSVWTVTDAAPQFCGPMSGLSVPVQEQEWGAQFTSPAVESVISTSRATAFFRVDCSGVPVFLSLSSTVVDLDAPITTGNFDVRDHFIASVPIVLYTKWALDGLCWSSPHTHACLVIDDPLLKPRYGFLKFTELLDVMRRDGFSANIAFIPWNWRRSTAKVVRMFKDNSERYSLSIHGCDHTGAEFGTRDVDWLAWKVDRASQRMSSHESRTGISHDRVMVFPQGVFSEAALGVLKRADFIAAVNTEVISADPEPPSITVSDVWDVAVMNYHRFPLFTRRYPSQGIENLAFDVLLGKPCLIVAHHDLCRDRCERIAEFARQLNALNCRLSWVGLGDVIRGACRQRQRTPGFVEVEMYASELVITNNDKQRRRFVVSKRECDPSLVKDVLVDDRRTAWKGDDAGLLRLEFDLEPERTARVRITFHEAVRSRRRHPESVRDKVKTLLRRVGSEARDNYLARISPQ
jgi:hypothetical protein